MPAWIEERTEALRREFGGDLWRLTDSLPVTLLHASAGCAYCVHRQGSATIVLPARLMGSELDAALAHELGHALFSCGVGSLLRQLPDADFRTERLARVWDWQDERRACAFAEAWDGL